MKRLNKKGFTLIELLAVIVILAVVLGIAIPAVSQYITKSKKNGYRDNLIQFIDAARKAAALDEDVHFPVDKDDATIVTFEKLSIALEKGGKESSYGNEWDPNSYVVIVNVGSADSPAYEYYVKASDKKYITSRSGNGVECILESDLKASDIKRSDTAALATPTVTKDADGNYTATLAKGQNVKDGAQQHGLLIAGSTITIKEVNGK